MKKIISVLFSLIFACALLSADSADMDKVFTALTANKVTTGDFVQTKTSAKLKKPIKSSGTFIFSDQGIVWRTLKPFPSTMAVTKTSIIQTKPDGTKNVTDGSSNEVFKSIAQTLSSLFSGNRNDLEQYFNIEESALNGSEWKMTLSPKDKTMAGAIKKIELSGSYLSEKSTLNAIRISQGEKDSVSYELSNQVYRQELTDDEKSLFR